MAVEGFGFSPAKFVDFTLGQGKGLGQRGEQCDEDLL